MSVTRNSEAQPCGRADRIVRVLCLVVCAVVALCLFTVVPFIATIVVAITGILGGR